MNEGAARRKLDKKLDTTARDSDGGTGNTKGFHKAVRAYGKALVDAALEDTTQEESIEDMDVCVLCGTSCPSLTCSSVCHEEAIRIGIIIKTDNRK